MQRNRVKSQRGGQTRLTRLRSQTQGLNRILQAMEVHSAVEWPRAVPSEDKMNNARNEEEVWLGQRQHSSQTAHPEVHVQVAVGSHGVLQERVVDANQLIHRAANCGKEHSHSSCVHPSGPISHPQHGD